MTFDVQVFLTQLLGFLVLLFLLRKFLWGRLLAFLDGRREEIRNRIADSEQRLAEAREKQARVEARLSEVDAECAAQRNDSVRQAQEEVQRILSEGRAQGETEREKLLRSLDEEKRKARNEIKDEVVRLSLAVAERLLARQVTDPEASRLADEAIAEIREGAGS